jgi:hypothetical protein
MRLTIAPRRLLALKTGAGAIRANVLVRLGAEKHPQSRSVWTTAAGPVPGHLARSSGFGHLVIRNKLRSRQLLLKMSDGCLYVIV